MAYNSHSVITEPVGEWTTLEEAKEWMKIDFSDDDALITALIPAARRAAEHYMHRKVLSSGIIEHWSIIPGATVTLYWSELISVDAVKYLDENGDTQSIDSGSYSVATTYRPPFIMFADGFEFPTTSVNANAFTVEYTAGYVDAESIPDDIVTAMKMIMAFMYENRTDSIVKLPMASEYLLMPYYIMEA